MTQIESLDHYREHNVLVQLQGLDGTCKNG